MSRQYFMDLLADPPLANQTAVTATTETILWNTSQFTPIAANDARPGKIWKVTAGGVMSFASTGTLTITPRFGLTVAAGVTLGAGGGITTPGTLGTTGWVLEFNCVCRTVGAPGANSTVIGTGFFITNNLGTAGTAVAFALGGGAGVAATVDVSIATGITIGWALTVAGSCTPEYACIQSLN